MHVHYTNDSPKLLLPPCIAFLPHTSPKEKHADFGATKQSEGFRASDVSPPSGSQEQPYSSHWPVDVSKADNPNAFKPLTARFASHIERNIAINMSRYDSEYTDTRFRWNGCWPVSDNPAPSEDVNISNGSWSRWDSHVTASFCATGSSAVLHNPGATSGDQLVATQNCDGNNASRPGLAVASGNNCVPHGALLTCAHGRLHHAYPHLVETALSNRPIPLPPYPRPITRRSFRPQITTSMLCQPDSTRQGPHVAPHHNQQLTSTVDLSYLDPVQNQVNYSNKPYTYSSPQTMAPDVRHISYYPPFTGSYELRTNSSRDSQASSSDMVGKLPGSCPESATNLREIGPDTGSVRSQKRRRDASLLEDIGVHVDPCTLRVPCGWHGCQMLISPDRMKVKYHLVGEHNVRAGGDPVTCAHPTCAKEIKADSMWQHWITHLGIRIECTVCHVTVAPRLDSFKRHVLGNCRGRHGRFVAAGEDSNEDARNASSKKQRID